MSQATARIASVAPQFVDRADRMALADWLSYFDPDIVLLTGDSPAPRAASRLREQVESETLVYHPAGRRPTAGLRRIDGVQFVLAPTLDALRDIGTGESRVADASTGESPVADASTGESPVADASGPTFVLSGLLALDVDTTTLSTSLVGREAYVDAVEPLDGECVHISARLPADYRREWDGLTVLGGGREAGYGDTPLVALDCRADGRVLTRSLNRSQLGLQALDQVGPKRARQLGDAGFTSRADVAATAPETLADLEGLGRTTAERIQESAAAIANGDIVRRSDAALPDGKPVFIDIETDGLSPTITWLVGVLDGSAEDGEYRTFLARDPEQPGRAIESFMAWYTTAASHRPLVAYHGRAFDFSVLRDHIVEYCPHYEADWDSTYRFDPYRWAVEEGNALLPGRTNKLEDVAGALGYDRAETGVTGAAVARSYRQWMTDQSPATEPDWERFEAYCEDDVRGLAVVYEALKESGRVVSASSERAETTQRTLSDW